MYKLQVLWLFLALAWSYIVKCSKECEFSNVDYKSVVAGIDGKVRSSESLFRNVIKSELPTLTYSLINVTLTGMKDCQVIHTQCDKDSKNELTFQYYIQCPHISITYNYEADGKLDNLLIEGHGVGSINAEDYVIKFDGIYENLIGRDQIPRPFIKKYTMATDPKGIVKFNVKNLYHGDEKREALANKFFNDNWREMEKLLRSPTMDSLMDLFVENFNSYSKAKE